LDDAWIRLNDIRELAATLVGEATTEHSAQYGAMIRRLASEACERIGAP
jgi:hypothetical protein